MSLDRPAREESQQIARELARIARSGGALPGSLTERHTYCGRPGCACQRDPPRPHGPYWQWTRKVKNKTVTRWLTRDQAANCERLIENDRQLRELLARLQTITIASFEEDRLAARAQRR